MNSSLYFPDWKCVVASTPHKCLYRCEFQFRVIFRNHFVQFLKRFDVKLNCFSDSRKRLFAGFAIAMAARQRWNIRNPVAFFVGIQQDVAHQ